MNKPRLLDLFCKAGGAGKGYDLAGFDVVGVDIEPQPRYPFKFIQADALDYVASYGWQFDAIHASPPCQAYTQIKQVVKDQCAYQNRHIDLIPHTRFWLKTIGVPYVIENVRGAPLDNPLVLCGRDFGLKVYRHRLFESNVYLIGIPHSPHHDKTPPSGRGVSPKGFISVTGNGGAQNLPIGRTYLEYASEAMGINWMSRLELSQAIPPAYTEYIGQQLIKFIRPSEDG